MARFWCCEFCRYQLYDKDEMIKHLKDSHCIDVYDTRANHGFAAENLIVSDAVIPENLRT